MSNHFFLQGLFSWKMIGLVEERNGHYYLLQSASTSWSKPVQESVSIVSNSSYNFNCILLSGFDIWHYQLGHLSFQRLNLKHSFAPDIDVSNNTSHCSICLVSKQHRLSCPNSYSHSSKWFGLTLCNICGSFHTPSIMVLDIFLLLLMTYQDVHRYISYILSQASSLLQSFFNMFEIQLPVKFNKYALIMALNFLCLFLPFQMCHSSTVLCWNSTAKWCYRAKTPTSP